MELNDSENLIIENFNKFRTKPSSQEISFNSLYKTISKFPLKKNQASELQNFTKTLKTKKGGSSVKVSDGLCSAAIKIGEILMEKGLDYYNNLQKSDMIDICRNYVGGFKKISFLAEECNPENLLPAFCISGIDIKKQFKIDIFDEEFKICGISVLENEENLKIVLILADNITEGASKKIYNPEDYPEYKEAFDLFDVCHNGVIDCKEIKKSVADLGFEFKSPPIFKIIQELDDPDRLQGADFNTFMEVIEKNLNEKEKDGIKNIFSLYKDDPTSESISLRNLKKLCIELNEKELSEEVSEIIKLAGNDLVSITFDEFSKFFLEQK